MRTKDGSKTSRVVQEVVYKVLCIGEDTVTLKMLPEYCYPSTEAGDVEDVAYEGPDNGFGAPQLVDVSKANEEVTIQLADLPAVMRLTHAMCYHTLQGRTLRNHTLLLDTSHLNFSRRALIVGLSRATHGDHVHCATSEEDDIILGNRRRARRAKHVITV